MTRHRRYLLVAVVTIAALAVAGPAMHLLVNGLIALHGG
jgi:hypothetical protein